VHPERRQNFIFKVMTKDLIFLAKECPSLNITVSAGELIEAVEHCVKTTRRELEQQITDANTETYPSVEQVAKMLDVDKSTLWRWNKHNYLKPISIGGKRRYRMKDVKRILEG
jgi:transcriptional regulator with PAS, ATPase and Fis domain